MKRKLDGQIYAEMDEPEQTDTSAHWALIVFLVTCIVLTAMCRGG